MPGGTWALLTHFYLNWASSSELEALYSSFPYTDWSSIWHIPVSAKLSVLFFTAGPLHPALPPS